MSATATKEVTVNADQRLYVIPCGNGFSCLGFDVCKERIERYAAWTIKTFYEGKGVTKGAPISRLVVEGGYMPDEQNIERYNVYLAVVREMADLCKGYHMRSDVDLSPQLVGLEGRRVEVEDKYGDTRRFNVGKSTGPMPIHLEIHNSRSRGGGAADREYKRVTVIR